MARQNKMFKCIPLRAVLVGVIFLDVLLFFLFGHGWDLMCCGNFKYAAMAFGYCTLLNIPGLVGIGIIVFNIIDIFLSKKKFTVKVKASCMEKSTEIRSAVGDEHGGYTYYIIWSYEYNGRFYEVRSPVSTNIDLPKTGSTRDIFINAKHPGEGYYDPVVTRKILPVLLLMAVAMIVCYIGVLHTDIMMRP